MERLKSWLRRRGLLLVVVAAFLIYILLQLNNLAAIARALVQGNWLWVGAAALLQVVYYVLLAYVYELGFAVVGVASRTLQLAPVVLASRVVQAAIPSGGVAGLAVFIDDARRRGQSGARATAGTLLVLLATLLGTLPFVLSGIGYLWAVGALASFEIAGTIIFLAFIAGIAALVFLGRMQPRVLYALFHGLEQVVNGILRRFRRPPLEPGWGNRQAESYVQASMSILRQPRRLRFMLAWSAVLQLINVLTLYLVGIAYNTALPLSAAVVAAALDIVFSIASPIPLGIGVVEGVIGVALISLGVPAPQASAIALVYRGLSIYLPLLIGFFFLRQLRTFGGERY